MILLESGTDVAGVYSTSSAFGTAHAYGGTAYRSGFGFGTSVPIRKGTESKFTSVHFRFPKAIFLSSIEFTDCSE
jgi:hypothetical protein